MGSDDTSVESVRDNSESAVVEGILYGVQTGSYCILAGTRGGRSEEGGDCWQTSADAENQELGNRDNDAMVASNAMFEVANYSQCIASWQKMWCVMMR